MDELLTVEEAAARLRISVATARRWAASGKLPGSKSGKQWVFRAAELPPPRARSAPTSIAGPPVDLWQSLKQLSNRDLREVWVPDILAFEDVLSDKALLMAEASRRIAAAGPFDPIVEVEVPKNSYFSRPGAMPSIEDRLAFHAAVASVVPLIEPRLSDSVFAARQSDNKDYLLKNGRDQWLRWKDAVVADIAKGRAWCVKTDINAFFETIPHRLLFPELERLGCERTIAAALKRMLSDWAAVNGVGLPQGGDPSRVLANFFLVPVDDVMTGTDRGYFRFMDDFRITARSRREAIAALQALVRACRARGLTLSSAKTKIMFGDEAVADLEDSELDTAQYWMDLGVGARAQPTLRAILKRALASSDVDRRRAAFSLYRLRTLRDSGMLARVIDRLDALAPSAEIAVQYLYPFLARRSVRDRLTGYLTDPDRNTSTYLSCWLLAAMLDAAIPLPKEWTDSCPSDRV